jgi:predicted peptidase
MYQRHRYVVAADTLPYRLLLPANYDAGKTYPLVVFLHGAGERGTDNNLQLIHGAKLFLQPRSRDSFPAIVVMPQCRATDFWSNVRFGIDNATQQRQFEFLTAIVPLFRFAITRSTPTAFWFVGFVPAFLFLFKI